MHIHEFNSEELRRIIFGKDVFRNCPACDNKGLVYWDKNGCPSRPSPLPEWGDDYEYDECEQCKGVGYNIFPVG